MQKFLALQINHDLHAADCRAALCGEMTPERASELCLAGVYAPTKELLIADGVAVENALWRCFAAGNGHPEPADDYQVLVRSHSLSIGDCVREDATGRTWLLTRPGWTELAR